MELELLREAGFSEVRKFLEGEFGRDEPRKQTDAFWRWKCTEPHPFWPESRGFLRRSGGEIVAYGGLIPLRFLTAHGSVPSGHVIDWAATRRVPGAGIRLYKAIAERAGSAIGIGGAASTRELLPLIGAVKHQSVFSFQRVVNPLGLTLTGRKDWKLPARFLRALRYALPPLPHVPSSWEAVPVSRFDDSVTPVLPRPSHRNIVVPERTVDLLNYWLRCPIAGTQGYLLVRDGQITGYFLLSVVPPAGRISDLWIDSDRIELWRYAYSLAFRSVAQLPGVLVADTMSGDPLVCAALQQMSLRQMSANQVFLLDRNRTLPAGVPIALSMTDYDAFYL
ncbi:MAG: hypothetical protein ACKV22_25730 [Bryobacteraceae bacterium]